MWRRGRRAAAQESAVAVEERLPELPELQAEISALTAEQAEQPRRETERRLLELRHHAGIRITEQAPEDPSFAAPEPERLPASDTLPEFTPQELTPGLVRAAIQRDGCVLVRGLIDRGQASEFAAAIDRAYAERELHDAGQPRAEGYYEEFEAAPGSGQPVVRSWIKQGGGLLAADSPILNARMIELFRAAGLPELVSGYLGEPALISVHKTTLRKADPSVAGAWHQDGYFMGPVRSLNLWLALSRCGDVAPGLDILPRRLERYLATATDEAVLDYTISERKVEEAADGRRVLRPIFEPGDALLFDELFLHQTGSDPAMPNPRFAIENWFFGGSRFPEEYAPVAVL